MEMFYWFLIILAADLAAAGLIHLVSSVDLHKLLPKKRKKVRRKKANPSANVYPIRKVGSD